MEQVVKCNSLSAIYRNNNLILGGPHLIQFDTMQDNQIHIKIEQFGIREIMVTSKEDISVFESSIVNRISIPNPSTCWFMCYKSI